MNEELQKAILAMLNSSMDSLGHAKDFALEQAPDVIQQFLHWEMVSSLLHLLLSGVYFLISLATLLIGYRTARWLVRQREEKKPWTQNDDIEGYPLAWIILAVATLGLFLLFLLTACNYLNSDWLHIWIAPKDYLIREALKISL